MNITWHKQMRRVEDLRSGAIFYLWRLRQLGHHDGTIWAEYKKSIRNAKEMLLSARTTRKKAEGNYDPTRTIPAAAENARQL